MLDYPQDTAIGGGEQRDIVGPVAQGRRKPTIIKTDQQGLRVRNFGLAHDNGGLGCVDACLRHAGGLAGTVEGGLA